MEPNISIMMVTYNRLELTKQTLTKLWDTAGVDNFNLVIVDNGSSDDTVEWLKSLDRDNIHFIFNKENKGIGIGRNQALYYAHNILKSKYFATMDNDVICPQNFLKDSIEILDNTNFAMIGVNFEGKQYPIIDANGYKIQYKAQGNLGTAFICFSKAFKLLGYFDTSYGKYGLEDSNYGMRAQRIGLKLGYVIENGIHLGEEPPEDPYRQYKTKTHDAYLDKFNQDCRDYYSGKKSVYISWKPE